MLIQIKSRVNVPPYYNILFRKKKWRKAINLNISLQKKH
jgi:hypothetical protein